MPNAEPAAEIELDESPWVTPRDEKMTTPECPIEAKEEPSNRTPASNEMSESGSCGNGTHPTNNASNALENAPRQDEAMGKLLRRSFEGKGKKTFLPVDKLEKIITKASVYNELQRRQTRIRFRNNTSEALDSLARKTCHESSTEAGILGTLTTRKKIFATLALMDRVEAIEDFVQDGLYDCHLPFYLPQAHDIDGDVYRLVSAWDNVENQIPLKLFSRWQTNQRESFEDYQWRFLTPVFKLVSEEKPRPLHYELDESQRLPFVEAYEGQDPHDMLVMSGGFSQVWRVKIHAAHHDHPSGSNNYFAVKRLNDRTGEMFRQEVATLKRLSGQDHPHLMSLQLTYLWQGQYHLLFQWADGNLAKYWERFPEPEDIPRTHGYAQWVVKQFVGLTEGLRIIHQCPPDDDPMADGRDDEHYSRRTRGRHGDLKPQNILWFNHIESMQDDGRSHQQGRFVISDFGLTSFHRSETGFVSPRTIAATPTYRPPEYEIGDDITQSFDLWTWGCILLEFVVWYLQGYEAWDDFSQDRTDEHPLLSGPGNFQEDVYFLLETRVLPNTQEPIPTAIMKDSVVKKIVELREHPNIPQFLVDLLDLIEDKLLRMCPEKRGTCDEVAESLKSIYDECLRSEEYCIKPAPGSKPVRVGTDRSELRPRRFRYEFGITEQVFDDEAGSVNDSQFTKNEADGMSNNMSPLPDNPLRMTSSQLGPKNESIAHNPGNSFPNIQTESSFIVRHNSPDSGDFMIFQAKNRRASAQVEGPQARSGSSPDKAASSGPEKQKNFEKTKTPGKPGKWYKRFFWCFYGK